MSLLSLADAQAQCRLDGDYPAAQLQPYIDGAEAAASAYLNCGLFAMQADLEAARDVVPQQLAAAGQAWASANTAAQAMTDANQQRATLDVAQARFDAAQRDADRVIHGVVANAAILAAVRLLLGHLFANRATVATGTSVTAVEVPLGAQDLLRPYRRVMTP